MLTILLAIYVVVGFYVAAGSLGWWTPDLQAGHIAPRTFLRHILRDTLGWPWHGLRIGLRFLWRAGRALWYNRLERGEP